MILSDISDPNIFILNFKYKKEVLCEERNYICLHKLKQVCKPVSENLFCKIPEDKNKVISNIFKYWDSKISIQLKTV